MFPLFDNYCLVITYVTKHVQLHVCNLLVTYCHLLSVERLQLFQHLVSIKILHVFNHLVSVAKLRVIGHLVSVTKRNVFNHLASVAKPQVFHYLVSEAKIFDIIYQLSPLLECDPTVCLPSNKCDNCIIYQEHISCQVKTFLLYQLHCNL